MTGYKFNSHVNYENIDYRTFMQKTEEAKIWCKKMFGEEYTRWAHFVDGFNFNDEKDYLLFLIRWGPKC